MSVPERPPPGPPPDTPPGPAPGPAADAPPGPAPAPPLGDDLALLRAHEPVIRFTKGELFYPCAVDGFVKGASLWALQPDGEPRLLVPRGELTVEQLAAHGTEPTPDVLYLRFTDRPLTPLAYQQWLRRPERVKLQGPGRLARVPLPARVADSLFDLSLLVRGRVPGGTVAAAEVRYRELRRDDPRRVYYGRAVRAGGWTVLHYLFFYTMNDWRSSFFGVNDHETDWEQVFVYLCEDLAGRLEPRWVAYASHDFRGDDLRRRWDDPLLRKVGSHPVIYAGAGSHASYFEPGEYVMSFEPAFLKPATRALLEARRLWADRLGMGPRASAGGRPGGLISIPFVDYARGDGLVIGPGQDEDWSPVPISDADPWVDRYRGLWGLDTRDPLGGERAPAGPKYNRDGSVRQAWYDPLGWAGLDKVTPPAETLQALDVRLRELDAELAEVDGKIGAQRTALRRLALDAEALRLTEHPDRLDRALIGQLAAAEQELQASQARRVVVLETRRASAAYRERVLRGDWGDPQAHLHHSHHPEPPALQGHRLLELWAAVSGALVFLAIAAVAVAPSYWWVSLAAVVVGFAAVEAATRGRLVDFLLNASVVLAAVSAAILAWEFWRLLLIAVLAAIVVYLVRDNLRELAPGRTS
jgi:hypothetical protein